MGKDKKKAGMVAMIMKKMKGSKYDEMKSENEEMTHVPYKDGAEQDHKSAMDECASHMMQAFESKDTAKLKDCMKSMVKMIISENEASNKE